MYRSCVKRQQVARNTCRNFCRTVDDLFGVNLFIDHHAHKFLIYTNADTGCTFTLSHSSQWSRTLEGLSDSPW